MSGLTATSIYPATSVDDAGAWLIKNVPNESDKEVTFVVSLNNREISVQLSTKTHYGNTLEEAIPYLTDEVKKQVIKTVNPKLECLTVDEETLKLAKAIASYIYENKHSLYSGASIDAHRLGKGRIYIGNN